MMSPSRDEHQQPAAPPEKIMSCNKCSNPLTTALFVCSCGCVFCEECTYSHFEFNSECPSCSKSLKFENFVELVVANSSAAPDMRKQIFQHIFTKLPNRRHLTQGDACNRLFEAIETEHESMSFLLKQLVSDSSCSVQHTEDMAQKLAAAQQELAEVEQEMKTHKLQSEHAIQDLQQQNQALDERDQDLLKQIEQMENNIDQLHCAYENVSVTSSPGSRGSQGIAIQLQHRGQLSSQQRSPEHSIVTPIVPPPFQRSRSRSPHHSSQPSQQPFRSRSQSPHGIDGNRTRSPYGIRGDSAGSGYVSTRHTSPEYITTSTRGAVRPTNGSPSFTRSPGHSIVTTFRSRSQSPHGIDGNRTRSPYGIRGDSAGSGYVSTRHTSPESITTSTRGVVWPTNGSPSFARSPGHSTVTTLRSRSRSPHGIDGNHTRSPYGIRGDSAGSGYVSTRHESPEYITTSTRGVVWPTNGSPSFTPSPGHSTVTTFGSRSQSPHGIDGNRTRSPYGIPPPGSSPDSRADSAWAGYVSTRHTSPEYITSSARGAVRPTNGSLSSSRRR